VTYNEFCDVLLDEDYAEVKTQVLDPTRVPGYVETAERRSEERKESEAVRAAVRRMGDVVYEHSQLCQRLCKEFAHMTHLKTVTVEQIQAALLQTGHSFETVDVERVVLFLTPGADLSAVNYVEFLKSVVASYHEMSKVR